MLIQQCADRLTLVELTLYLLFLENIRKEDTDTHFISLLWHCFLASRKYVPVWQDSRVSREVKASCPGRYRRADSQSRCPAELLLACLAMLKTFLFQSQCWAPLWRDLQGHGVGTWLEFGVLWRLWSFLFYCCGRTGDIKKEVCVWAYGPSWQQAAGMAAESRAERAYWASGVRFCHS